MGLNQKILVKLLQPTLGQADTVLQGLKLAAIDLTEPITIFNIDTFRPRFTFPKQFDLNTIDGYLEVFRGTGTNWSYVQPLSIKTFEVAKTIEKIPISDLCSTGLYYFREANLFLNAFNIELKKGREKELFIAPIYNHLIKAGAKIFYHEIQKTEVSFCGTPNEYQMLKENNGKLYD